MTQSISLSANKKSFSVRVLDSCITNNLFPSLQGLLFHPVPFQIDDDIRIAKLEGHIISPKLSFRPGTFHTHTHARTRTRTCPFLKGAQAHDCSTSRGSLYILGLPGRLGMDEIYTHYLCSRTLWKRLTPFFIFGIFFFFSFLVLCNEWSFSN